MSATEAGPSSRVNRQEFARERNGGTMPALKVAAMNVDGTLIEGNLDWPLPVKLVDEGICTAGQLGPFQDYLEEAGRSGLEDMTVVARAWEIYAECVAGVSAAAVAAVARRIWLDKRSEVLDFARPLVALVRQAGLEPVLVSLGPHELVTHLARHLGVTFYSGTVMAERNGVYTGQFTGVPALGKIAAAESIVPGPAVDWPASMALGNSLLDTELLNRAGLPIAFEPSPTLREHALRRGWLTADRKDILHLLCEQL